MSGGKGGSTTSSVQIPSWLEDAAKTNLSKADYAGQIGYTPYYGPDVAAQTQSQLLGNQATYDAAAAFGLVPQGGNANAGMPTPTTYAGGVTGYSSGDLYDQAVAELASRRPGQASALNSMFIDPYSGEQSVAFTPMGSISNVGASDTVNSMVDYAGSGDFTGDGASAVSFQQGLQNLADAPSWVSLLPVVGSAKGLATMYVNNQANKMNPYGGSSTPYLNTNRGFSDDGSTYTSSWGQDYDTSGMSAATQAGLSIASSQNDLSDWSD